MSINETATNVRELAEEFIEAKKQAEEAKAKADSIKSMLQNAMMADGVTEVRCENADITLTERTTIKFDAALISYLKTHGYETYVMEALDEAAIKKTIKESEIFRTQIESYTKKTEAYVLTVKEKK